jgi:type 1 fimbria pilin
MKNIQLLAIGTGLFTLSALNNANAVNTGNINFTGKIVATLCNIEGGGNLEVPLGIHPVTEFTGANSRTPLRDIVLNLQNCPESQATITFQGTEQGATGLLALAGGGSENIAIALFENDGATPLRINTPSTTIRPLVAGNNTITYRAAYEQYSATAPTVGVANGTAILDIVYN